MRTEPPTGDELTRMLVRMKRNVLEQVAAEPALSRSRRTDRILGGTLIVAVLLGLGTAGAAIAGVIGGDGEPAGVVAATSDAGPAPTTEAPSRSFPIETAPPPPPPAVDPLTTVSTISVRPEHLDLLDASGAVVAQLSYFDDPTTFAAALTTALGVEAEIEDHDGWIGPDAYIWFWPGVSVGDGAYDDADNRIPISVTFAEGMVGDGVVVTTAVGFTPGGDLESFAAAAGLAENGIDERTGIPLEYGPELGPSDGELLDAWAVMGATDGDVYAPYNPATRLGMRG